MLYSIYVFHVSATGSVTGYGCDYGAGSCGIDSKLIQPSNALSLILVTDTGIIIDTNEIQSLNVSGLIVVNKLLVGNVIDIKLLQPWNAPGPMLVTELGIIIDLNDV